MPLRMVFVSDGVGVVIRIDLVTVFDRILTSRQTREKLQCLYENPMSNNFHKTTVLKKILILNLSYTAKDFTNKFCEPLLCLNFSRSLL